MSAAGYLCKPPLKAACENLHLTQMSCANINLFEYVISAK